MDKEDQKKALQLLNDQDKEITDLKKQLKVAKNIQSTMLDELTIEKVIRVKYRKGLGTRQDPVEIVTSYWDMEGNHLFDL